MLKTKTDTSLTNTIEAHSLFISYTSYSIDPSFALLIDILTILMEGNSNHLTPQCFPQWNERLLNIINLRISGVI